jgi:LytS/YehU family sensor histidine kinase
VGFISIWFNYRRMPQPSFAALLKVLGLAMTGAVCGAGFATLMDGKPLLETLARTGPKVLLAGSIAGAIYAVILGSIALWRNREYETLNTQLQLQTEREKLARQVSESQLSLLRAQIEPHFLFNTLGAVQQLAQSGAPKAAELTANLIAFLRASLSDMRQDTVTLTAEYAIVEAYLKVMQARLGERLQFALDLPQALRSVRLPGMLLLTLVENAIKHGIEPALRGGEVTVSARWEENALTLRVSDTGVGLAPSSTNGVGLSNVRTRLLLSYGTEASLQLHNAPDGGVTATMCIPYVPAVMEGAMQ